MIQMRLSRQVFEYPSKVEPEWARLVERWYQLDAAAFGLANHFWNLKSDLSQKPSFLILASSGASNETDFQFVQSGAASPSKFVHTLPSVRGAPLLQVMQWQGPVLCLQNDPQTWLDSVSDAMNFLKSEESCVWILSVKPVSHGGTHEACLAELVIDTVKNKFLTPNFETFLIESSNPAENTSTTQVTIDLDFWNWLDSRLEAGSVESKTPFVSKAHGFRICRS